VPADQQIMTAQPPCSHTARRCRACRRAQWLRDGGSEVRAIRLRALSVLFIGGAVEGLLAWFAHNPLVNVAELAGVIFVAAGAFALGCTWRRGAA